MQKITLTKKQQETLDFIKTFIAENGEAPTIVKLCEGLNLKSLRSITQRLESLEAKGFIKRDRFKHKGITVLDHLNQFSAQSDVGRVPVIASAGCDAMQVYAQQSYDEFLVVDRKFLDPRKDIVAIKAFGNSMIDAGIHNGDYVLVEITGDVYDGDRVVAIIGDMAVIKRFKRIPGAIMLNPESKDGGYAPIVMSEDSKIFGKVLRIIHASYRSEDDLRVIYENNINF